MDQRTSLELLDFCHRGPLYEELVGLLEDSFKERFRSQSFNDLDAEFQKAFLKHLDGPHQVVLLLIVNSDQFERAGDFIEGIKQRNGDSAVIVITQEYDAVKIFELMTRGASDFIVPPINAVTTLFRISRLVQQGNLRNNPIRSLKAAVGMRCLVGTAPSFLAETKKIPLVAGCDGRVLITGETGTGKELVARAIHYLSLRTGYPFVPVSCGAMPVDLVENELFGHVKGAFTGAASNKPGLIQEAENGTLFLDEVDALPLLAQTKLLRFLQEGEYRPLGAAKSLQADVRVIAASNANLARSVSEGRFRQDLYYRLNIIRIKLPPLRERREDIPLLAKHFLDTFNHEFHRNVQGFTEAAIQKLLLHEWPGNIRELENSIEQAVALADKDKIGSAELLATDNEQLDQPDEIRSFQETKARIISKFERSYIRDLMVVYRGNISQAARAAKKNRRAFWELVRKHKIDVADFRTTSGSE